ncbi:MAG: hypothetical protein HN576_03045 [Bacteriovoracaceae bacterium]|jgi:hypothetical protein|nr:hypothetical protein [Bacteriovoracaceae bacterium]
MGLSPKTSKLITLLESKIFFNDAGGIYAWIDGQTKKASFQYSEISGYFLSLTSFLKEHDKISKDSIIFRQASQTVEWLLNMRIENQISFIDRITEDEEGKVTYFFDDFIISNGLLNFSIVSSNQELKELALNLIDNQFQYWKSSTSFNSMKDLGGIVLDHQESWSTVFGPHHLKFLVPLINAFKISKDKKFLSHANELIEKTFNSFLKDSVLYSQENSIHIHSLLYALEGLCSYSQEIRDEKIISIISANFSMIQEYSKDHLIPRFIINNKANLNERMDVYFQFLRLDIILTSLNISKTKSNHKTLLSHCENFFKENHFVFGKESNGTPISDNTSWINFIALQYYVLSETKTPYSLSNLI